MDVIDRPKSGRSQPALEITLWLLLARQLTLLSDLGNDG